MLLAALLISSSLIHHAPPSADGREKPVATPAPAAPTAAQRARAAVDRLKSTLLQELQAAITAKGAAGAVDVCGDVASRIRSEVSAPDLTIGRTSTRLRNPKNTAPAWVTSQLLELERLPADKRSPREVALPGGAFGYVEPLTTQPLCLACHGTQLAPDVRAAIADKYPQDQATGFAGGDLRGVVWVEVKHTPPPR